MIECLKNEYLAWNIAIRELRAKYKESGDWMMSIALYPTEWLMLVTLIPFLALKDYFESD